MIKYCSICLNHEGDYFNPEVEEKIRTKSNKVSNKDRICTVCRFELKKKIILLIGKEDQNHLKKSANGGKKIQVQNMIVS